ncbi:hypothetical protein LXM56_07500 [Lysinibacillus fusiformis]|uniref:hypothetical protein n=1 Tax=Lysinibacillus fusiformis TaxID=28031 RepID=UPI001E50C2E9|nr:hypothetical protein [Lysinibacillus fusiformis]MCE4043966.1 hypothetical protein [Lysinibacillus fusiformis]
MSPLLPKAQNEILISLDFYILNKEMHNLLKRFFTEQVFTQEFPTKDDRLWEKHACLNLIDALTKCTVEPTNLTWESYCMMMQYLSSKDFNACRILPMSRRLLSRYYLYIPTVVDNLAVKEGILPYSKLFLNMEFTIQNRIKIRLEQYKINLDLVNSRIKTNFPIGSSPNRIIPFNLSDKNKINIFINCTNEFLFTLLKGFLLKELSFIKNSRISSFEYRLFNYYFEESLKTLDKKICDLSDFDFKTFKQQLFFFDKIEKEYGIHYNHTPKYHLNKFYLYLDKIHFSNTQKRLLNQYNFNNELFKNSHYNRYVLENWEFIYKNPFDAIPKSDKWILMVDKNITSSRIDKSSILIDFSLVFNESHRMDLKEYIWASDTSFQGTFRVLKDFLNTFEKYQIENVSFIRTDSKISHEFLLKYRASLEARITKYNGQIKSSSVNNELQVISAYLRYFKEKYEIRDIAFQIFRRLPKDYNGGNPIELKDLQAITNYFQKSLEEVNGELFFIIFQLSISTKLRIGEIINLERDCLIHISEALGYGEIEYVSKTSNGEKVKEILLIEEIKLIKKAIKITNDKVKNAHDDIKKYIFLISHSRFNEEQVILMQAQYGAFFKQITDKLYEKGIIQNKYVPYNARHSYIDQAYQKLEDGLLTTMEVIQITGNTPMIASKHYRKYQTIRYVEATYMISIGDVNIDGEILTDERELQNLPQVQRDLGGCKSDNCIKEDEDDTDYKCLICKKFATSIQRMQFFEVKLEEIRVLKINAANKAEIDYYRVQEELYGAYLTKIYTLREDTENDRNKRDKLE